MAGETDLARMLASLAVERRPGSYAFVGDARLAPATLRASAEAAVREAEGWTWVVPVEAARGAGAEIDFEAAWLTLTVHSALDAVGLTAAVSGALAEAGIACNVLAGSHHDHLLVPVARADDAVEVLDRLAEGRKAS